MKQCSKCKQQKGLEQFNKSKKNKDGLKCRCRSCQTEDSKIYLESKKDDKEFRAKKNKLTREWRAKQDEGYYKEQYWKNPELGRERARKYYKKNTEKCLESNRVWRKNNREIYINSSKKWKENNKEYNTELHKLWMQENKEHVRNYNRMRRAMKQKATVQDFTDEQLEQRMSIFNFKCVYCGGPFEHIDHIIPLSKGGSHCLANLRPSCAKCNLSKHNKNVFEWLNEKKAA